MPLNDPTLDQLIIETGGQRLEGWLTSRVVRGVELCPSYFDISLTERFPGSATTAVVVPGSTCKVFLGGDLILTGYIDQYSPSYDGRTHFVRINGRTNTQDVVDSSIVVPPWEIQSGSLKQAVENILKQFPNVGLVMKGADAQIPIAVSITQGETAYSVIESLCRMTSRLLWDDENGNLVISEVGTERAGSALVEGQNVEAAAVMIDWSNRFNKIAVVNTGQTLASINVPIVGEATDDQIRSTRFKYVIMDGFLGDQNEKAKERAYWELNRRKGRSEIVQVHVTGWRDRKGALWTPNTNTNVSLPTLKIQADLVIAQCMWERDENGTRTIMTCMPPGALKPTPYVPPFRLGQGTQ